VFIRPAVVGDTLYVGSCSGYFHAIARRDGASVWIYDTSFDGAHGQFHGEMLIEGDRIVVGTDAEGDGHLYAFDAGTGEVIWKQPASGGFPARILREGSRVYAVTMSGQVRCFELVDGREIWRNGDSDGDRLLRGSIALTGGRVVASVRGLVRAIAADSGETLWETPIKGGPNTTLAVIGDAVYVGDLQGKLHRLASKDGKLLGTFEAVAPAYGTLQPVGDCLLALWGDTTLACVDPALDGVAWRRETASKWTTFNPLVLDDLVLAGTAAGEIHAMNRSTGASVWTRELEGQIKSLLAVDEVLYVGTLGGVVTALPLP
jgi:outer membrane protein assembly factor BamB